MSDTIEAKKPFKIAKTDEEQRGHFLDSDVEYSLARRWRDERDEKALHQIINSYDRLALSYAHKFKRYKGSGIKDLEQEARLGLMKAAKKFDPDKGVRFSTYAMWWVKAALQEQVMKSYSHVKIGSTAWQKSLFFNMRRVGYDLQLRYPDLNSHEVNLAIAARTKTSISEVEQMQSRMAGDLSLNVLQSSGEDGEGREWIDTIESGEESTADAYATKDEFNIRAKLMSSAIDVALSPREKEILARRKLKEKPDTLETLSGVFGVSRERIRQLEIVALGKVQKYIREMRPDLF